MIGDANPGKDQVAFASAATTGFRRDSGDVTPASLALDACVTAIKDAGIGADDINGLVGANPQYIQSSLGIPHLTYWNGAGIPFVSCDRERDERRLHRGRRRRPRVPLRVPQPDVLALGGERPVPPHGLRWSVRGDGFGPDSISGAVGYTAWASRYLYEYHASRETFGYIAINDRTNAALNPAAALRDPLTMDDYLAARMIRWPLCLLDMDVPVDGADAFIVTTAERARDMALKPVLIHACTQGMVAQNEEDQTPSLRHHGQHVVLESLKKKSDIWIDDIDVYFPYDGFSFITVSWIENSGLVRARRSPRLDRGQLGCRAARILINGQDPREPARRRALRGGHAGFRAYT